MPRTVATARENTVATAAPWIPSSGNGPTPKISRGSSARLRTTLTSITRIGARVLPYPRISETNTKNPNTKGTPSMNSRM